jgi:hypothetical protein
MARIFHAARPCPTRASNLAVPGPQSASTASQIGLPTDAVLQWHLPPRYHALINFFKKIVRLRPRRVPEAAPGSMNARNKGKKVLTLSGGFGYVHF